MNMEATSKAHQRHASKVEFFGPDLPMAGCSIAGVIGIIKAMEMESAGGVFLCLVASVIAFGAVYYIHGRRI